MGIGRAGRSEPGDRQPVEQRVSLLNIGNPPLTGQVDEQDAPHDRPDPADHHHGQTQLQQPRHQVHSERPQFTSRLVLRRCTPEQDHKR